MAVSSAVRKAVLAGELPNIKTLVCADCGAPACDYHHYNGYEPEHLLDVVPLCRKCHRNRHRGPRKGKAPSGYDAMSLVVTSRDKFLLDEIRKRYANLSRSAMVRLLILQEAKRQGITTRS